MKILLIEDNPDDIVIIRRFLNGFEVDVAQTGAEGLEKIKGNSFDCILLDYKLPDANALELLNTIKDISSIPVIILTGMKDERLITGASKLGAVDFLVKGEITEEILSFSVINAITSKKKDEFLAKTEEIYEKLIEGMNEGLFCLDINEIIVFTNRKIEEMLYVKKGILLGKNITEIMDKDWYRVFKEMSSKSKPCSFETLFIHQNGFIPVLISSTPLFDKNGVFNGSLYVVTDLSKIKEMEEKLAETQKLIGASQIAAEAAHDIKNPLATIIAGLFILKKFIPGDEKIGKIISQIEGACKKISLYVDDLLNFSRPLCVNLRKIEINPIIKELLEDISFEAFNGIEIKEKLEENLPQVLSDPERLKQALFNLVRNAIDSMPNGGIIRITTYQKKDNCGIDIADCGEGIKAENLDKIFSPFFTTKGKGIGLGLSVVKRIVEAHNGKISVKSILAKGTTFSILLKSNYLPK